MLGISVYLGQQSLEATKKYIEEMYKAGARTIFTSLHIPEDDPSIYVTELKQLGELALNEKMDLMVDISPSTWQHLGISMEEAGGLKKWGVAGIRVDYGFTPEQIAKLAKNMKVALNASTIDEDFLQDLKDAGLETDQVEAWHNYYPRPETGLEEKWFIERNKWLKEQGLTVMAFIPGDILRGPLEEGLPTVEKHRGQSVFAAFLEMTKDFYVDKVCIGDRGIKEATWKQLMMYKEDIILIHCEHLPLNEEEERTLQIQHRSRMDPSRDVVRSETSRFYAQKRSVCIIPHNQLPRDKGTITIDNNNYGRYAGELQVTRNNLPASEKVNVIGRVVKQDIPLIEMISPGQTFSFSCKIIKE
ncbi:MupG family TIM beta-alpha barrel fold protein [Sutcliffiella horikoshii]|uniref:DUF871 domain-containing protein n=1 Tax=Sutcliffiella horikoshii TaxID=79883 RepID=UPI00384D7AE2